MATTPELLEIARHIKRNLHRHHKLEELAASFGLSPSGLQREFSRMVGGSPARYVRRLRLLIAATELLRGDARLARIAAETGFGSPEVLIRNFRETYGCTPDQYRRRHRPARRDTGFLRGLALIRRVGPCIPLFHVQTQTQRSTTMPMLSTELRTLPAQSALIIRSRVARSEIAATIGASLGKIVAYAMGAGGVLAGQPFARYPDFGPGLMTIDVGMPLVAPVAGSGEIELIALPAGLTAVAVHAGSYEQLPGTYVAFERWIVDQGRVPAGAPWELYVTDPADHPDPQDWRTEIRWPVR